jgi:hypothetical protein
MVKAAYPAVKAANPDLPVVVGALAAADRPFLDELYARGIQGSYDGISIHPYNEWRDPYDRWQPQWKKYTFLPGMEWVREGQLAAGDSTPLWITEFGWVTCAGHSWCVSENQQADYLVGALRILNSLDYVSAATAYELRDESTDRSDFEGNWGLVRRDFSEKPSFAAVRDEFHSPGQPVTLDLRVSESGVVYATGRSPASQQLVVEVYGCRAKTSKRRWMRTNRQGTYRRRLGSAKHLRGCSVAVRPQRSRLSVKSTVPGFRPVGVAAAQIAH